MSGDTPTKSGASGSESESAGDAITLLTQGKRHLLVKDYSEAVSSLGQACGLLAGKYGETADECGEAYLFYGKALLELAREESGVLGDAIEGEGSGEESGEETEEPEENDTDKMEKENGKGDADDTSEDKDENSAEEKTEDTEKVPASAEEKEQEDGDEDVSNLRLSWEMLELAKIIFLRQDKDVQMNLKLSEVYLNLGEVSLESETYEQAIQDLQSGLVIQKKHLEEDDRRIAEAYYRLGMAYSLNNEFDEAVEQYSNALGLLELRVKNLEAKFASGDKPDESDAFYTIEGEIKELKEIIPDVRDKIAELKDTKAEAIKALSDKIKQECGAGSSKSGESSAKPIETKPASNITHLVRKKQKVDETAASAQEAPSKDVPSPDAVPAKIQKSE